ncbi:MAG: LemA family protein [Brevundimonas sp.]|jgi:LemA protein|nr:LemA family protein [Brevundimonas sp.]
MLETDMLTTLIVIAVIVAVVLFVIVGAYNKLVALDQRADQSFADIDVQLKQRHDLIPNLVETVKGYASHERATFEAVTAARSAATTATSVNDKVQAENMLTGALGRLFALSEAYPDLKANTNFLELQRELSDIENKLAAARRFFNNAVSEFNAIRRQFPTVLFAAMVGFGSDKPFFDVGETDRAAMTAAPPSVSFQA